MSSNFPHDPCCYRCAGCERRVCRDDDPSPGESDYLCSTCWNTDDPGDEAA